MSDGFWDMFLGYEFHLVDKLFIAVFLYAISRIILCFFPDDLGRHRTGRMVVMFSVVLCSLLYFGLLFFTHISWEWCALASVGTYFLYFMSLPKKYVDDINGYYEESVMDGNPDDKR